MFPNPTLICRVLVLALTAVVFQVFTDPASAQDRTRIEVVPNVPHSDVVTSVAFSPEGTRVLSGSWDKTLKLWDAASGQLIRTFEGHTDKVTSVAFSPDGKRLLSGSWDKTLKLWDAATGQLIRTFEGHTDEVTSVAFSPDGAHLLSGSRDETLKLWEAVSGQLIRTFEGHTGNVTSVAFSPKSTRLLSGGWDKTLKLWDVATGQLIRTFEGHTHQVNSVTFSPEGTRLLSGSWDKTLRLWDATSGQLIRTFEGHTDEATSVTFSREGTRVLSVGGYRDYTLKLWDAASGQLIRTFEGYAATSVAFSPEGTRVLSVGGFPHNTLKLWDAASGQLIRTFEGRAGEVNSVAFSPDGAHLLSGSVDKTLKLWDAASGQLMRTFEGHAAGVTSVAFSPDGKRLLSGSGQRHMLRFGGRDNGPMLRDAAGGQVIRTFEGRNAGLSVAFSPDGARLLSGGGFQDNTLKLWDAATGQPIRTFVGHAGPVNSVAFSPDGARLLSGGGGRGKLFGVRDRTVKLWDAASGQLIRTFEGHTSDVTSVAFSPDGTRLLSGSGDQTLKLWDAAGAQLIRTLGGHSGSVNSVAFSPDGMRLLSGSSDGTVRIWKAATGELLASLFGARDGQWLAITPEGFFAASPKGHELLAIVRGLEVFSIDQFYQVLYRPDLVREKLAGDTDGKVRDAAAKLDLAKLIDSGRVPKVVFTSHKALDKSSSDLVTVEARLTDAGGGIGKAEWRISSKESGDRPITIGVVDKVAAGTAITLKQAVALDQGENTIELVAYNGQDLVRSVPARTKVYWDGVNDPTAPPKLHVLAIGIDKYLDSKFELKFAVRDAKAFVAALQETGKDHYAEVVPTLVTSDSTDVTVANLDRAFDELAKTVRPRDVFVLFAAGHGKTHPHPKTGAPHYYFIPQDFKYRTDRSYDEQGIGQDQIQKWLAKIPRIKKAVLIFDTCEAGSLAGVELVAVRGGFEDKAALGRLIDATGRITILAAGEKQPAYEGYGEHGVLTFSLLDALGRGDRDGNGFVSLTELIGHIDALVPAITLKTWGRTQIPQHDAKGINFPLVRQVAAVAPKPPDGQIVIPTKATHVNLELLQIFKDAGGKGAVVQRLPPFTAVTLVRTEQGWVLIARDGKALGYVAEGKLQKLN